MLKRHIQYLGLVKVVFLLTLYACHLKESPTGTLKNYLASCYGYTLRPATSYLVVLTEERCIQCNKLLSDFLTRNIKHINSGKMVLLLNASGVKVDVNPFLTANSPNILINKNYRGFKNDSLFSNSQIITLKNGEIENIAYISSDNMAVRLEELKQKLAA